MFLLKNKLLIYFNIQQLLNHGVHLGIQSTLLHSSSARYVLPFNFLGFTILNIFSIISNLRLGVNLMVDILSKRGLFLLVNSNIVLETFVKNYFHGLNHAISSGLWVSGRLTNFRKVRKKSLKVYYMHRSIIKNYSIMEVNNQISSRLRKIMSRSFNPSKYSRAASKFVPNLLSIPRVCFISDSVLNDVVINESFILNIPTIGLSDGANDVAKVSYSVPGNSSNIAALLFYYVLVKLVVRVSFFKERYNFILTSIRLKENNFANFNGGLNWYGRTKRSISQRKQRLKKNFVFKRLILNLKKKTIQIFNLFLKKLSKTQLYFLNYKRILKYWLKDKFINFNFFDVKLISKLISKFFVLKLRATYLNFIFFYFNFNNVLKARLLKLYKKRKIALNKYLVWISPFNIGISNFYFYSYYNFYYLNFVSKTLKRLNITFSRNNYLFSSVFFFNMPTFYFCWFNLSKAFSSNFINYKSNRIFLDYKALNYNLLENNVLKDLFLKCFNVGLLSKKFKNHMLYKYLFLSLTYQFYYNESLIRFNSSIKYNNGSLMGKQNLKKNKILSLFNNFWIDLYKFFNILYSSFSFNIVFIIFQLNRCNYYYKNCFSYNLEFLRKLKLNFFKVFGYAVYKGYISKFTGYKKRKYLKIKNNVNFDFIFIYKVYLLFNKFHKFNGFYMLLPTSRSKFLKQKLMVFFSNAFYSKFFYFNKILCSNLSNKIKRLKKDKVIKTIKELPRSPLNFLSLDKKEEFIKRSSKNKFKGIIKKTNKNDKKSRIKTFKKK